ncbi:MAG TPA: hypothetical protein VJX67_14010 [Blastocatellia bacterium]|nr:hypothetical protein [Blastocatellia bacterium]
MRIPPLNLRRLGRFAFPAFFLLFVLVSEAAAQCPMCSASIAGDPKAKAASHQMDIAILMLLIPAISIFTGCFVLIYKYRNHFDSRGPGSVSGMHGL